MPVFITEIDELLQKTGHLLAILHDAGLVHGDLTTSNMLVRKSDAAVVSPLTESSRIAVSSVV